MSRRIQITFLATFAILILVASFFLMRHFHVSPQFLQSVPVPWVHSKPEDVETQYEVESQDGALSHATEERIEDDIDKLSPETDEQSVEGGFVAAVTDQVGLTLLPLPKLLQLPEPLPREDQNLRIGFITDTHVGSDTLSPKQGRLKSVFVQRITYIVKQMNNVIRPDFIVVNGDVIEGTKVPNLQGMEELRQTQQLFNQTSIPKYWVLGNHDVRSVNKSQWKEVLGIDYTHRAFIVKGYKIIILDSNFNGVGKDVAPGPGNSYTRGKVSPSELEWLKSELATPEQKLVFLHHPPLRDILVQSDSGLLRNATELQDLFTKNNVIGVFAGHIEDLYSERTRGVQYFVFPGMTKDPEYPGNFVTLDIRGSDIRMQMSYRGKNGKYVTLDIEKEGFQNQK